MHHDIRWELFSFEEMPNTLLYKYFSLRSEVFIVEQNCPYQDLDGNDQQATHLLAFDQDVLVACARIFAPGVMYSQAAIGRVITKATHRKMGIGHQLMKKSVLYCQNKFGNTPIKIGAQQYLEKFYNSHGFHRVSEMYLEDGIPHIIMLRQTGS